LAPINNTTIENEAHLRGKLEDVITHRGDPWVVMNKTKTSCVYDPSTGHPWSTYNKRLADAMAHDHDGIAIRAKEAVKVLIHKGPV
jgi:hypothetical protein